MQPKTFYPTPDKVIRQMLSPYTSEQLATLIILEPEAGEGHILDFISKRVQSGRNHADLNNLYAVEIDPNLRAILESKDYAIVGEDFLKYFPRRRYDLIVMNPPFDHGEEHLLHAWEIIEDGEIVCLLNATSFDGKTNKERTIIDLVADHGTKENIGKVFAVGAERSTDVDVMLVRLVKGHGIERSADEDTISFIPTNSRDNPEFQEQQGQEVAIQGFVNQLVGNFNAATAFYPEYRQARSKIIRYAAMFDHSEYTSSAALKDSDGIDNDKDSYNKFINQLQSEAWMKIFDHPKFQGSLTERARKAMDEFRSKQKRLDFNMENIEKMLYAVMDKRDEFLYGAMEDAFATMTEYHEENRVYFEGWKSNKCWKVNHRVVLPYFVEYSFGHFSRGYSRSSELTDIDRALCLASGKPFDSIQTVDSALRNQFSIDDKHAGEVHSTFFRVRFYKKGTIHLYFKDLELLKQFNYLVAKSRNWLPPANATK